MYNDALVASSSHTYFGKYSSQREVQHLTTSAHVGSKISGTFALGFRHTQDARWFADPIANTNANTRGPLSERDQFKASSGAMEDGRWQMVSSKAIPHNVQPEELKDILESELATGFVLVERSAVDSQGGYTWSITFKGLPEDVPLLQVESDLYGAGARVDIKTVTEVQQPIKSGASIFKRRGTQWSEQAILRPYADQFAHLRQLGDRFGWSTALQGATAVVGAPNRDAFVPGTNAGATYTFDLGFLNLEFAEAEYSISEDSGLLSVTVTRCASRLWKHNSYCENGNDGTTSETINYFTENSKVDHYAYSPGSARMMTQPGGLLRSTVRDTIVGLDWPNWIEDADGLWLRSSEQVLGQPASGAELRVADVLPGVSESVNSFGSAGLTSSYTAKRAARLPFTTQATNTFGQYGYDLVADFPPSVGALSFPPGSSSLTFVVPIHNDMQLETPDEHFHLRLASPGIEPSPAGQLWAKVTIEDDGDGGVGTRGYADKLYPPPTYAGGFGSAVDVDVYLQGSFGAPGGPNAAAKASAGSLDLAISGSPLLRVGGKEFAGAAHVFRRVSGVWIFEATLQPSEGPTAHERFGISVAVDNDFAVVGAPGTGKAYVFIRADSGAWSEDAVLTGHDVPSSSRFSAAYGASSPQSGGVAKIAPSATSDVLFGGKYGVSISGSYIVVGAVGLEAAYVFRRVGSSWIEQQKLTASDYKDFSAPKGGSHERKYLDISRFGCSVDISGSIRNTADDFVAGDTIVVGAEYASHGHRTTEDGADHSYYGTGAVYVFVRDADGTVRNQGRDWWYEQERLRPKDRQHASRFGHAVSLSGNQLIVGSHHNPGQEDVSWDFESGDLRGWRITGDAFKTQPTMGANTMYRTSYGVQVSNINDVQFAITKSDPITLDSRNEPEVDRYYHDWNWLNLEERTYGQESHVKTVGRSEPTRHRGRFWVGTFEDHPTVADPVGRAQGDVPQGTMESYPFSIDGDYLSFLIGGGCDMKTEFVELLVDGIGVLRATGKCSETMERVEWNTTGFVGRSGVLRVVDASSSNWAHINFDDVQFGWLAHGRDDADCTNTIGSSALHESDSTGYGSIAKQQSSCSYGHRVAAHAGAAYTFRRRASSTSDPCISEFSPWHECAWEEQAKLMASDKRAGDEFGYSVSVDEFTGTAAIGAHKSRSVNEFNNETQAFLYPDGDQAGAIYIFKQQREQRDGLNNLLEPPQWMSKEHAKVQAHDKRSQDWFGYAVAVSGYTMVGGSPYQDTLAVDAGAVYPMDLEFQVIRFDRKDFAVKENSELGNNDPGVAIDVLREYDFESMYDTSLTIAFSTTDITAIGVTPANRDQCLRRAKGQRTPEYFAPGGCGDYAHTSGYLTFGPTERKKQIIVRTVDDACYERHMEYIHVQLSLPGGGPLIGESYSSTIRIDDDDSTSLPC